MDGERVADTLMRARQQLGQDLRSIANVLCIRYSYLDAIERGPFENLPGPTYAVGFMRSYADYLGLAGDQIVMRLKAEVDGLDSTTTLTYPQPPPEARTRAVQGTGVVVHLVLVGCRNFKKTKH